MTYSPTTWQDYPNTSTPINAARLNNIESGVVAAYVQGTGTLVNADLAVGAAIAASKIASYPSDATKSLRGDGSWAAPVVTRKTTSKAVTNTVSETDLLNGEFSVGAGALGTTGTARLTAWGDWVMTNGTTSASPRFKVKLGATPTVILDTGAVSASVTSSATRFGWRIVIEIMNSAAAVQWVTAIGSVGLVGVAASNPQVGVFTTGEGGYTLAGNGTFGIGSFVGGNSAAIDTTAAMNVLLTVINPSATTTETKLLGAIMEIL